MPSPYFLAMHGELIVAGKRPDGDTVRFLPLSPALVDLLGRADRLRPARDGTVQVRFEGVDAPETHYGPHAQPLGDRARDQMLAWAGFHGIAFDPTQRVTVAQPPTRHAVLLTQHVDVAGRPVGYLLLEEQDEEAPDGRWIHVTPELLKRTMNARLLEAGLVYPAFYTTTPRAHRSVLGGIARQAHDDRLGVWSRDESAEFRLHDQASIGPDGTLVYPKLFRRCTDMLAERGPRGPLAEWLRAVSATGTRNEDDRVVVGGRYELRLSDLLEQRNESVAFRGDLLDMVWVAR